jgi:hypothetical protein
MNHEKRNPILLDIRKILPNFLASPMEEIKTTMTKRPWMNKGSLETIF